MFPGGNDKPSRRGRYKFPGRTIGERADVSRGGRYLFPGGTICEERRQPVAISRVRDDRVALLLLHNGSKCAFWGARGPSQVPGAPVIYVDNMQNFPGKTITGAIRNWISRGGRYSSGRQRRSRPCKDP